MSTDLSLRIVVGATDQASNVVDNIAGNIVGSLAGVNPVLGAVAGGMIAIVGGAVMVGSTSTKMAADFQQAMLSNVAHAGLAKDQFDSVSQSVLGMASAVGRSPTELAEALYPILSAFSGITNQSAKSSLALSTLKLSFEAVAGTTVNGTDVANAAVGTFNALGLATNNASVNAQRMAGLFDVMDLTVQQGNMQWDAYKNVISKLAVSIQGTGIGFNEASSALATLTNEGYSAQRAQTYLSNMFTAMAIKTDALAAHAKKLGLAFDEQKYASMSLADKMTYLNEVTGGNKQKLLALLGGNATALRSFNALSTGLGAYKSNLVALDHAHGALATSFATASQGFNFQMSQLKAAGESLLITIGTRLLPVFSSLISHITPLVTQFTQWLTQSHGLSNGMNWLGSVMKSLMPFFLLLWQGAQQLWRILAGSLGPVFVLIGHMIMQELWPALQQAWSILVKNKDTFILFGEIIGGIVLVALGLLMGLVTGLIRGLAGILPGLAMVLVGVVQFVNGIFKLIGGFFAILIDLFTGNFSKLGKDWALFTSGITDIVMGLSKVIVGVFLGLWGAVSGILTGFWDGCVKFFTGLSDTLVGHSIIPDMIKLIIQWFVNLGPNALAAVGSFIGNLTRLFTNLAAQAIAWGSNLISGFAAGITGAIGKVTGAVQGIMSKITGFLGFHSPAKEGEGQHLLEWPRNMVRSYADELAAQTPYLQSKVSMLVAPLVMMSHAVPLVSNSNTSTTGGTTTTNYNSVTVNASGASSDDAGELAELVAQKLGRMLQGSTTLAGGLYR